MMAYLTTLGFTLAFIQIGFCAIMNSESSHIVVDPDETQLIELPCSITYEDATSQYAEEDAYSRLAKWKKQQGDGPEVEITSLKTIQPSFGTFVTMESYSTFYQHPNLNMKLTIDLNELQDAGYDVSAASGNYTCYIISSSASDARPSPAPVIHRVEVLRPISVVQMIGGNNPADNATWTTSMMYYAGRNGYFSCEATGSYPQTSLTITVDGVGITGSDMTHEEYLVRTGNTDGLQTVGTKSHTWSNLMNFEADDHDKEIKCEARVSAQDGSSNTVYDTQETERPLIVYYAPIVDCELAADGAVHVDVGDINEEVLCTVRARPISDDISLTMRGGSSNTLIPAGTRNDTLKMEFAVSSSSEPDSQTATILFEEIQTAHLAMYELTARNLVGDTVQSFEVREGNVVIGPFNGSSPVRVHLSTMLLPIFIVLALLISRH